MTDVIERKEWTINALSIELRRDRAWMTKRLQDLKPVRIEGRVKYFILSDVLHHLHNPKKLDPSQEAAKLNRAKRELLDIQIKNMKEALVDAKEAEELWSEIKATIEEKIMEIPAKAAPIVFACNSDAEIHSALTNIITKTLHECAAAVMEPVSNSAE